MTLLLAIIGNLVGDYLLQNDWMALNKKKRTLPCIIHCAMWTLCVCIIAGWFKPVVIILLFVTHLIQDRTNIILWWMTKLNSQKVFATGICAPWSIIVVDNVWHIFTLYIIWKIFYRV